MSKTLAVHKQILKTIETTITTITSTSATTTTTITTTTTTSEVPAIVMNGGGEDGTLSGWLAIGSPSPTVDNGTANLGSTPSHSGSYDFYGGAGRILHQIISLTSLFSIAQLDSGLLYVSSSFWERSANQTPADTVQVTLNFLSATNSVLSNATMGPQACIPVWCYVTGSWSLPVGTRKIDYIITFDANYGSYADAWVDDNLINIA